MNTHFWFSQESKAINRTTLKLWPATARPVRIESDTQRLQAVFYLRGSVQRRSNILMLTPIIYMLTVYDRVVASGSLSTLAMLTILMVCLLLAVGGFEWVRSMILVSASNRLETLLRKRISDATFKRSLWTGGMVANAQPFRPHGP